MFENRVCLFDKVIINQRKLHKTFVQHSVERTPHRTKWSSKISGRMSIVFLLFGSRSRSPFGGARRDKERPALASRRRTGAGSFLRSALSSRKLWLTKMTDEPIESLAKLAEMSLLISQTFGLETLRICKRGAKHKILSPQFVQPPCSDESCVRAELCSEDEFARGLTCYPMVDRRLRAAELRNEADTGGSGRSPVPKTES